MDKTLLLQIATNLDLSHLQFQGEDGGFNPVFLGILGGLILIVAVVSAYFTITRQRRLREKAILREEARLRLALSEANLGQEGRDLLESLAQSYDPTQLIPLLSTRTLFESTVEEFRLAHPDSPVIKKVPHLRQSLGYGFGNLRNPFTHTRMLTPGTKMQCIIPHPKRVVRYITTILGTSEEHFFIRPPMARGRPVSLASFANLDFKVSREDDAEYEFTAKILGQMSNGGRAVRMEHSHAVRKLLFREAPRMPVALDLQFYVIKQEIAAEKRHRVFKRNESQYVMAGRSRDLSLGGMCLIANPAGQKPMEGDLVVFSLPAAQIKEDIVAEILDVVPLSRDQLEIHLKLSGLKEINRLKLGKFLQMQKEAAAGGEGVEGSGLAS